MEQSPEVIFKMVCACVERKGGSEQEGDQERGGGGGRAGGHSSRYAVNTCTILWECVLLEQFCLDDNLRNLL